jgi:hypothetical protein
MNQPPLTKRETIAAGILQALVSKRDLIDDTTIAQALDLTDRIIDALDKTAPVPAPPAAVLPIIPEHLPKPPEGCVYWGNRPLDVPASTQADMRDVWVFCEGLDNDEWEAGFSAKHANTWDHVALRRGSPIAIANGITS